MRKLRSEGKVAFFVRLEHIPHDFEASFEEGSFEEFQSWIDDGTEGWLLLDSVDEARLRDPRDFEAAVRRLGHLLTAARQRVHIVITGRTHAWRPNTDLALCARHLPFARADASASVESDTDTSNGEMRTDAVAPKDDSTFRVVALDDLSLRQIETFASAKGIANIRLFLDAIERADALSFASRPQDLEELIEFWKDYGRIGSKLDLIGNSVEWRLRERDQDRADARPLSAQRAREGSKLVAAASTMVQEPTVRVPDGASNSKGLPISSILPSWSDIECATLLSRPIFDEAIYGTVRFHHRSTREYLTAEWLSDLLQKQSSRRRIEDLFFRQQYGIDVIVPTTRPFLPWLAILDERIRKRVVRTAPEVLLEGGDPRQLPAETRRQILCRVCGEIATGAPGMIATDYAAIQRFASSDLTASIRGLIEKYANNDDLIWFLLRMVWQGELGGALPEVKRFALSPTSGHYPRIAAFRALAAIGSTDENSELRRTFANEGAPLKREWLAELLKDTDPSAEAIQWLFACLEKVADKARYSIGGLSREVAAYVERMQCDDLALFVDLASSLLERPPVVERRHCEVSEKFAWLLHSAGLAVQRMIKAKHAAALDRPALGILHKVAMGQRYGIGEFYGPDLELNKLVPEWTEANLALFWYLVEEARKWLDRRKSERLTEWWRVDVLGSYVQFNSKDFKTVLAEVAQRQWPDDKLVALSLAFRLYVEGGRQRKWRQALWQLAGSDEALSQRLSELMRPPREAPEQTEFKKSEARWKRRNEARRERKQANREASRTYIINNIDKLRDPGFARADAFSKAQYYLYHRMREDDRGSSSWSEGKWEVLRSEFGDAAARAFRDGVVAYWRKHKPKLVSEGAPINSTPFATVFGLTGLTIEAREESNWSATLTEIEAEIAFRYAMRELNGFPVWFPAVFAKFSGIVRELSLNEIRYELSLEAKDERSSYLLYDVSSRGDWLWDALAPELYEIVASSEPKRIDHLRYILNIVQGSSIPADQVARLASRKCRTLRRPDHSAPWFAVWLGVDPDKAIAALEKRLASIGEKQERTRFAMTVVTQLLGDHRSRSTVREAFRMPEHLKNLYLLMRRHIRKEEDIDRAGKGAYSPELRDDAQDAREQLFALLREIPGKKAFLAVEEIARGHQDEDERAWFTFQARKKAELDADIQPWALSQVIEFHNELERTPSDHHELFDLAVMRFLDLKDDLEEGDSSNASLLSVIDQETEIRKYIGNWCRDNARGRYTIPQEEELADAKRPDLRWHGVGFDAPVSVELKLADNWNGPELLERLETQLCGDYLRDRRSARGIFVVVYRGARKRWQLPGTDRHRVDFRGLVHALEKHWSDISEYYPNVDEIRVIGIDLTKRSRSSRPSRPARS